MQKNFGGEVLEKFKPTYNLEEFKFTLLSFKEK